MGYYVKVTKVVAQKILGDNSPLTMTKDGNCLLWQSELNGVNGITLSERAKVVGGALLPESQAIAEIEGVTDSALYCYTPIDFGGKGDTRKEVNIGGANPSATAEGGVTPSVEVELNKEEEMNND